MATLQGRWVLAWTDIIYYYCSDVNRAISNGAHYTAQGYFGQHHQGPQGPALACTRLKLSHLPYLPGALQTRTSNPPSVRGEGLIQFGYAFPLACCCCSRLKNPPKRLTNVPFYICRWAVSAHRLLPLARSLALSRSIWLFLCQPLPSLISRFISLSFARALSAGAGAQLHSNDAVGEQCCS